MKPTNHLFLLVRSLTAAEKRYFKLFANRYVTNGKRGYEKLFDAMDNWPHEVYNEKQFLSAHRAKAFVKYFADEKHNLQELIMKAMRIMYTEDTVDNKIYELLAEEDFFRKKRLNELRAKALDKAKRLAYQYEKQHSLLTILEREVSMQIEWSQETLSRLYGNIGAEETEVMSALTKATELKHINHRLFIQVRINTKLGNETAKAESLNAVNHPLVVGHATGLSFVADQYYYRILSLHHRLHGDTIQHKEYAKLGFELFETEYPHQKESRPVDYRVALFNYLNACFVAGDLDAFPALLKKAKALKSSNADEEGEEWQSIVHLELIYLLNTAQLERAASMASEIDNGLRKYQNKVNTARQLAITYNLAAAFLVLGKWEKAMDCYNSIIADNSNARSDLKENAELLLLVIHFELNNLVLLDNLIVNVRRRLRAANKLHYNAFLSSLSQHIKHKGLNTINNVEAFESLPAGNTELNLWVKAQNEQRSLLSIFMDNYSLANGAAKQ